MKTALGNQRYWRNFYDRRRRLHDVSGRQLITGQVFTILVSTGAGVLLSNNESTFILVGGALVLYPGLVALLSSNASSLSASIHHEYDSGHTGRKSVFLFKHFINSLAVTLIASIVVGCVAGLLGELFFATEFWRLLLLALLAASITATIGYPIMIGAVMIARKRETNPDDVAMPIESTLFELLIIVAILFLSRYLL